MGAFVYSVGSNPDSLRIIESGASKFTYHLRVLLYYVISLSKPQMHKVNSWNNVFKQVIHPCRK